MEVNLGGPRDHWPASLARLMSPMFTERYCLKNKVAGTQGTIPKLVLCLPHMCKHVSEHVCMCAHTYFTWQVCKLVSSAISHRVMTPWTKIWRHLVTCYPTQHCKDQICAQGYASGRPKGELTSKGTTDQMFCCHPFSNSMQALCPIPRRACDCRDLASLLCESEGEWGGVDVLTGSSPGPMSEGHPGLLIKEMEGA